MGSTGPLHIAAQLATWPTPKAQEDGRTLDQYEAARQKGYDARKGKTSGGPASEQGTLAIAAQLASWPTARANDGTGPQECPNREGGASLKQVAAWAMPTVMDSENRNTAEQWYARQQANPGMSGSSSPTDLSVLAQLAPWATPTASEKIRSEEFAKGREPTVREALEGWANPPGPWPTPMAGSPATETYNEAGSTDSSRKTVELASGTTGNCSPAATASTGESPRGRLNPAFSLWLQGFRAAWLWHAPANKPNPRTKAKGARKPRRKKSGS